MHCAAAIDRRRLHMFAIALLLFCLSTVVACRQGQAPGDSFYKTLFMRVDTITLHSGRYVAQQYMDSALGSVPRDAIPVYYIFQKYGRHAGWSYFSGQLDTSGLYLDSMVRIMEANNFARRYPADYANVLNSTGDNYFRKGDFPKAFDFYSRSRIASLATSDTCAYSNQTYHLGMVTYRQEKYSEAVTYFKEAVKETGTCSDPVFIFFRKEELLSNIGLAYSRTKEYDSAASYFHQALVYTDTAGKRIGQDFLSRFPEMARGVIMGNLAKVYIARGQLDTAEQLLRQSIAINGRHDFDTADALYSTMQLAELYVDRNKLPDAMAALQQLAQVLRNTPAGELKQRWLHLEYRYSKATNDHAAAMQYLEQYVSTKDALEQKSRSLKQTDYVQLLKQQEAEFKIKYLSKKRELDKLYLFIALGLSTLTIVVIILIYVYYRRSRKNVKLLTLLNHRVRDQKTQLETAMSQLQHSNNDKDRILHVVAHDLRNPINAIQSLINIILMDDVNEEHKEMLHMMNHAADNSLLLISEILEFSGNIKGRTAGEKERVDLNELAKQAVGVLQFKADEKKQTLTLAVRDEPLYIVAYPSKISRVLGNLISNAIKFSPENSDITISMAPKGSKAMVIVKDRGVGIPAKNISLIFDTFTSAKRLGTAGEPSFGLGLSICKQIVEAVGGRIWVESVEGEGASFFIEFPRVH